MVVLNLSVGKVLRSMERCGVDFSLVSSIESTEYYKPHKRLPFFLRRSTLRVCKKTVRAVKRHPDKLGALLWIQTGRKIPVERLSRFIEKNRQYIYGIKIHPYRSEVAPDDPRMEPVYALAKRFGCWQSASACRWRRIRAIWRAPKPRCSSTRQRRIPTSNLSRSTWTWRAATRRRST